MYIKERDGETDRWTDRCLLFGFFLIGCSQIKYSLLSVSISFPLPLSSLLLHSIFSFSPFLLYCRTPTESSTEDFIMSSVSSSQASFPTIIQYSIWRKHHNSEVGCLTFTYSLTDSRASQSPAVFLLHHRLGRQAL